MRPCRGPEGEDEVEEYSGQAGAPQGDPADPGPGETTVLVRRAQDGDGAAKSALYTRLREPLLSRIQRHHLFRVLRRFMSAEDLLGDLIAHCEVTRAFDKFRETGPHSVRRFLDTVVGSTLCNAYRRHFAKRRGGGWKALGAGPGADRHPAESLPSPAATPTSDARVAEMLARVQRLLTEREWDAWRCRWLDGLEVDEIAARAGTTRKAIWSLLQRAQAKLLGAFGPDYPGWTRSG